MRKGGLGCSWEGDRLGMRRQGNRDAVAQNPSGQKAAPHFRCSRSAGPAPFMNKCSRSYCTVEGAGQVLSPASGGVCRLETLTLRPAPHS